VYVFCSKGYCVLNKVYFRRVNTGVEMSNYVQLREADKVEITVLIDNYVDWLMIESTDTVKRPAVPPGKTLLAEHGLSLLIRVYADSETRAMIMDAGVSRIALPHNVAALDIDVNGVDNVVLSHGHIDHFGALFELLPLLKKATSITLHPDAFLERRISIPALGVVTSFPTLDKEALEKSGTKLNLQSEPTLLASGLALALGEIERVTDFEQGFPWVEAKIRGEWQVDPFRDDQGVAIKLKNKGIVVIGGCSHAGIINTVRHALEITGSKSVEAVMGGFHLTGPLFEPVIEPTIDAMLKLAPHYVIPMHCTGWKATTEFARGMPEQFILNTVGTTYVFGG
jgi:7,8-dihydropterin-6-yl-methyl-4-(beta-D-ribofuranosyl)aminobenzene 5'-phosphate synthase